MDETGLRAVQQHFNRGVERYPDLRHLLIRGGEYQRDWVGHTHLQSVADYPPHARERCCDWVRDGAYEDVVVAHKGSHHPTWACWINPRASWHGYFFGSGVYHGAVGHFSELGAAAWRALELQDEAEDEIWFDGWDMQRWLIHLCQMAWKREAPLNAPRSIYCGDRGRFVLEVDDLPRWRATKRGLAGELAREIPEPPRVWSAVLEPGLFLASSLAIDAIIQRSMAEKAVLVQSDASALRTTHKPERGNWPVAADLVTLAQISNDTFRRIRTAAQLNDGTRGYRARDRRYSPEEVVQLSSAVLAGAFLNREVIAQTWCELAQTGVLDKPLDSKLAARQQVDRILHPRA